MFIRKTKISRERERVSYKFINSYESIQYVYPSNTNTYVYIATQKKKKKHVIQKRFYGKTIGEYIYKFWNFVNRFLVACCIFC